MDYPKSVPSVGLVDGRFVDVGTAGFVAEGNDASFVLGHVHQQGLKTAPPTAVKPHFVAVQRGVHAPAVAVAGQAAVAGIVRLQCQVHAAFADELVAEKGLLPSV